MAILSIAICTYNRPELLEICLSSVVQLIQDGIEIVVIDNGTEKVKKVVDKFPDVNYVIESNTGLSFARNKAIEVAKGDWILYLDDDAKVDDQFVSLALLHCKEQHLVFGGVFLPWYHFGRPKWYKDEYGSNKQSYTKPGILPPNEYLCGGVIAIHKSVFNKVGMFQTELGMIGTQVGYAEETELQDRIRNSGIDCIYDDKLIIYHVVAPYKLNVEWFLKSYRNLGIDMAKYQKGNKLINLFVQAIIAFFLTLKDGVFYGYKLVSDKDYYKENWQIDALKKWYKRIGYVQQTIRMIVGR